MVVTAAALRGECVGGHNARRLRLPRSRAVVADDRAALASAAEGAHRHLVPARQAMRAPRLTLTSGGTRQCCELSGVRVQECNIEDIVEVNCFGKSIIRRHMLFGGGGHGLHG